MKFTDEELEIARSVDLVSIAERQGFTVKRVGSYYTLKEHDSIRIKNRRSWLRFSVPEGQDGHSGDNIEFLRQFCYMDFREAVIYLLNEAGYRYEDKSFKDDTSRKNHERRKEEQKKEPEGKGVFVLPEPNDNYRRLYAYLLKTRCLSKEMVDWFVKKKLIYETRRYHNVVFIGRGSFGTARFASMRGTVDNYGNPFKGDVENNDKTYGFNVRNKKNKEVKVFEAAIDLMSYMDYKRDGQSNKLALGSTWDGALDRFLLENPQIKRISLYLDNDKAGRKAAALIRKKYIEIGYHVKVRFPPHGKDWNEFLVAERKKAVIQYLNRNGNLDRKQAIG